VRPLDRLVTKAADPIELSRIEPVEEDAEILFRLAGKPDDERGANGQLGANLTPARDALQSFFLPCGALHALEHGLVASLSRLTDLPFAEIKLDAHFVSGCGAEALKQSLCKTVVDLAQRFGASVCADGVETETDLRCLATLGFDTAQGFLLGRPMPAAEFAASLIVRHKSYPDLFEPNTPAVSRAAS
jgi:predicted signal transduction protein with EAL and GGDEF domain